MTQQRLDRIEDEFETVKQLLASAASYAEMAHQGLAELTIKQDRTQIQLDQLSVKLDQTDTRLNEFIFHTQRLFTQAGTRVEQLEGRTERLENIVELLNRNYQVQQNQFSEFQRTTNAALERIDRVLDYLLRQQKGEF